MRFRRALAGLAVGLMVCAWGRPAQAEQFDQLVAEKCPNAARIHRYEQQIGPISPSTVIDTDRLKALYKALAIEFRTCAAATPIAFLHDGALVFSLRDSVNGLETNGDQIREDPKTIAALRRLAATTAFSNIRDLALEDAREVQGFLTKIRILVGH